MKVPITEVSQARQATSSKKVAPNEFETTKYYAKFDFFYKRTVFRTMTEFYKNEFKSFQALKENKKLSIKAQLLKFSDLAFPRLTQAMEPQQQREFIELLKMIVLCHRINKNEPALRDLMFDFSLIRDPMYKYSKNSQEKFFDLPILSFFFVWFAAKGTQMAMQKFSEKKDEQ